MREKVLQQSPPATCGLRRRSSHGGLFLGAKPARTFRDGWKTKAMAAPPDCSSPARRGGADDRNRGALRRSQPYRAIIVGRLVIAAVAASRRRSFIFGVLG